MSQLCQSAQKGEVAVRNEYEKYLPLLRILGRDTNPISIKEALYLKGLIRSPETRLPLTPFSAENRKDLEVEMGHLGVLA